MNLIVACDDRLKAESWIKRMQIPMKDVVLVTTPKGWRKTQRLKLGEVGLVRLDPSVKVGVPDTLLDEILDGVAARVKPHVRDVSTQQIREVVGDQWNVWKNTPAAEAKTFETFGVEWTT